MANAAISNGCQRSMNVYETVHGNCGDLNGSVDEYDDMEDCYSGAFPLQTASSSFYGEVATSEHSTLYNDENSTEIYDKDSILVDGEYRTFIERCYSPRDANVVTGLVDESSHIEQLHHIQSIDARESSEDGLEDSSAFTQTTMFKRRKRIGTPADMWNTKCCDRCCSDLNGKLIVRCASCSFRRHLYCFTPPLKQHPAFQHQQKTSSGKKIRLPPSAEMIARWRCDKCISTEILEDPPSYYPVPSITERNIPTKRNRVIISTLSSKTGRQTRKSAHYMTKHPPVDINALEKQIVDDIQHPVQKQWRDVSTTGYDWHEFRSAKAAKVLDQERQRTHTKLHLNSECMSQVARTNELVYYSASFSLMKKTVALWHGSVEDKKHFQQQRQRELVKRQPPQKRYVMHVLTPEEKMKLEEMVQRRWLEEEEIAKLFDDSTYKRGEYVYELLRLRNTNFVEPCNLLMEDFKENQIVNGEDKLINVIGEPLTVKELVIEMNESLCLAAEDVDVNFGDIEAGSVGLNDSHRNIFKLQLAAKIIHRVCLGWKERSQRMKKKRLAEEQRRISEELLNQRKQKALMSLHVLRLCIGFILVLVRKFRQIQVKKELLLALQDTAEDCQAINSSYDDAMKQNSLAKKRICRFFYRRVHPYVKTKKTMMVWRIMRWWKRIYLLWKGRSIAVAALQKHQNAACSRIQHLYRHFRTKEKLRVVLEKHALKKVQRFFRGWLLTRMARKEKLRVQIYTLALALNIASNELVNHPDGSVKDILYTLGMAFYDRGEFWNAASMLERMWMLSKDTLDWDGKIVLAYSHHKAWHTSYDAFNLQRAYDHYCEALDSLSERSSKDAASIVDPFILQDLAIVMMHMENFSVSLQMFAKLIEFFSQENDFPLWLLLAAVQLQQRGEWEQSVKYLVYLQDIPPPPYLERDILTLCAIGYESIGTALSRRLAKEAWKAALRQWTMEKKVKKLHFHDGLSYSNGSALDKGAHIARLKWEMVTEFALRALVEGHYLLTSCLYLYVLERNPSANTPIDSQEQQRAWWYLADAFRHLGHLDLYLNAAERSRDGKLAIDAGAQRLVWKEHAEKQARSFQLELSGVSILQKLQMLASPDSSNNDSSVL